MPQSYREFVQSLSPSLYWALNAETAATDLSGNGRHGTGAGGITIGGYSGSPITGESTATDFDGTDDRVTTSYAPLSNGTTRTFSGWAYRDNTSAYHSLIGGVSGGAWLTLNSGDQTVYFSADGFSTSVNWASAWPGNTQWVHWALIFAEGSDSVSLYLNGTLVSTQAYATAYSPNNSALVFGAYATFFPFDGKMAHVAVFESALTAAQIANLYRLGTQTLGEIVVKGGGSPVNPNRLGVSIETPDGTVYPWKGDEPQSANVPTGIRFGTSIPGGFKDATLSLPREITKDYPDLGLYNDVRIYGPGNESAWEGRVAQLPRSHSDVGTVTVGSVGHAAHLKDDPSFAEIYVDRDLSNWSAVNTTTRAAQLATYTNIHDASPGVTGSGTPSLILQCQFSDTSRPMSVAEYNAGSARIGTVRMAGSIVGYTPPTDMQLWVVLEDTPGAASQTSTDFEAATVSGTYAATATTRKYAQVFFAYVAAALSANYEFNCYLAPVIYGNSGLTVRGTAPDDGFYASDVIANIVARAAPLLRVTSESIEDTTFAIPQLAFPDPTTAEDAILATNAYHLWEWGVWEDKTFFYREPNPDRLTWEARLSHGAHLDLEGETADEVYNGVVVHYSGPDGASKTVGPTGATNVDATDATLLDSSTDNPLNQHGIRRWGVLEISQVTTQAGAIQLGAIWLAEQAIPQRRGSLVLKARDNLGRPQQPVVHPTAGPRPVWAVRAGDWIRVADHPADIPRRIIETNYEHDQRQMTLSLGNTVQKLEAILERFGAELVGVI